MSFIRDLITVPFLVPFLAVLLYFVCLENSMTLGVKSFLFPHKQMKRKRKMWMLKIHFVIKQKSIPKMGPWIIKDAQLVRPGPEAGRHPGLYTVSLGEMEV